MKFQIEKDVFQDALNQVQHVVSSRTTLPILSNVLIRADELGLELSTTDLDVTITKRVAAKVASTGATTLPARRLASIVRELPTNEIDFEVNAFRKYCLLNGFDDIGLTLRQSDKIKAFEAERLATKPWLAHTM
jgi:DNA polymerase-3 subunit beta